MYRIQVYSARFAVMIFMSADDHFAAETLSNNNFNVTQQR
jgi:hypothetical protein